jgi:hypothetical protein
MSKQKEEIKPGIYQHYKGNLYEVIGIGNHSETLEKFVVYRALYDSPEFGPNAIWVRPYKMFLEEVEFEGKKVLRFEYVKNAK